MSDSPNELPMIIPISLHPTNYSSQIAMNCFICLPHPKRVVLVFQLERKDPNFHVQHFSKVRLKTSILKYTTQMSLEMDTEVNLGIKMAKKLAKIKKNIEKIT